MLKNLLQFTPRFFSTQKKTPIKVTPAAWKKMKEIAKHQKENQFIFSATTGGCNGFNYDLQLSSEEIKSSIKPTQMEKDGVLLVIDPMAEMLLLGTTVDYINQDYASGVFESKFTFTPDKNLATSCGCGVSFTPREF